MSSFRVASLRIRKRIVMLTVWLPVIFLFLVLLGPISQAGELQTPFIPPEGQTLLLVGQNRDTIAQYVSRTGNIPGGTMVYTSIQKLEGLYEPYDIGNAIHDGEALLQAYPDSVIQIGLYMVDGLDGTLARTYDANLKRLAQWIKKADRPVYLRIGYEFDLPENRYAPGKYRQAFRYVVDFLRQEGVRNVAYVWHSVCYTEKSVRQVMDWYPGDDYVDWFAASMFAIPSQLWTVPPFVKLARDHHKPFMIAESTPWGIYTISGKIDWLKRIFQFINDQKVEAFCYINSNWNEQTMFASLKIGDARLEKNAEIKEFWLKEIAKVRYVTASPDLFRLLGWVRLKQ